MLAEGAGLAAADTAPAFGRVSGSHNSRTNEHALDVGLAILGLGVAEEDFPMSLKGAERRRVACGLLWETFPRVCFCS